MLFPPIAHAANPPETWQVVKVAARCWALQTVSGVTLETYGTRLGAIQARTSGFLVKLYEEERRWYAGESVPHHRPFAEVAAEASTQRAWAAAEVAYAAGVQA